MPSSGKVGPWSLNDAGRELEWLRKGNMMVTDDVLGIVSLAESGLGICQTYDFIVRDKIKQGGLLKVLQAFKGRTRPFSIIYPPHRQLSPASRALIDFLTTETSGGNSSPPAT
ncbi:LysR substrate binding domain protein [compost metagenome]